MYCHDAAEVYGKDYNGLRSKILREMPGVFAERCEEDWQVSMHDDLLD
jgi:hypothetical protein